MTTQRGLTSDASRSTSRNKLFRLSHTTRDPMIENPWQGGPANIRSSSPGATSAAAVTLAVSTSRRSPVMNSPGKFARCVKLHA